MYLESMTYAADIPFVLDLHMFDANPNTNVTTQSTLSAEMKTFYDKNLIENASPLLVHDDGRRSVTFRETAVRKSSLESMYSSASLSLR